MTETAQTWEVAIRAAAFAGIFLAMAGLEIGLPRRAKPSVTIKRWMTNLAMVAIDSVVLRVVFPMAAVGAALWAEQSEWGMFPAIGLPVLVAGILGFIILDFAVWLEHWASHKIPILWRIHRVHHADVDVDLTTALRFHPFEILISMVWKAGLVVAFGIPVISVLIFEIVLNGMAMFNHANVKLPLALDRRLRSVIVTPDMHRIHHSIIREETDSNFGFNLSWWDHLFGHYRREPSAGHHDMILGLPDHQNRRPTELIWSLVYPFRRGA